MNNIDHLYSYTAVFEDGTSITQDHTDPEGDKSLTTDWGSRFTDVQEKEKESKLISFVIHNDEKSLGVDLRDGHFEINGIPFWQHRQDLKQYTNFRVIYTRTIQRVMNQVNGEELSGDVLFYNVGWQVTDQDGKNVQRVALI